MANTPPPPKRRVILRLSSLSFLSLLVGEKTNATRMTFAGFAGEAAIRPRDAGTPFLYRDARYFGLCEHLPRRGSISECEHRGFLIATEASDKFSLSLHLSIYLSISPWWNFIPFSAGARAL